MMNRHTKMSLFIVPFLLIGGFIASDFYVEHKADEHKVFQLLPFGHCDVLNKTCVLKSGEFEINLLDNNGVTTVNSTFPLDKATLFLVDNNNQVDQYPLGMKESPYYWHSETPLRRSMEQGNSKHTLRLVAEIKGGKYISEFYTETIN